ncbi:MAG: hypothetical protein GZ094_12040 [Mariniphaga sp.]|nr:hypothetical protein [Mariniphaga sp.]
MKHLSVIMIFLLLASPVTFSQTKLAESIFDVLEVTSKPVITKGDPGTESNLFGFEGGRALKFNNEYHLFTTEINGSPVWNKTRLAHWKSCDGEKWTRLSTVFESSGNFDGTDTHACLWSPMPTFDKSKNCWCLTYVAYRSKPNDEEAWYRNYDGRIYIAYSQVEGQMGIYGPYKESGLLLEPGQKSANWEGLMGVDSFFPYKLDSIWMAFYGSSTEVNGLASANNLSGPWERISMNKPVSQHTENPIVTQLDDGKYIAFFDGCGKFQRFGYMLSDNGVSWSAPVIIDLEAHTGKWWGLTRTPLGLISAGNGLYTLFFTAYNKNFYNVPGIWSAKSDSVFDGYFASLGKIILKIKKS